MAFVTCSQFKASQTAQDAAAMKAESSLLDCAENATGVTTASDCDDDSQGGVITVAKIIAALASSGTDLITALYNAGAFGTGLTVTNGVLSVKTEAVTDASAETTLFYAVDTSEDE